VFRLVVDDRPKPHVVSLALSEPEAVGPDAPNDHGGPDGVGPYPRSLRISASSND
jgi:hypothetical protein